MSVQKRFQVVFASVVVLILISVSIPGFQRHQSVSHLRSHLPEKPGFEYGQGFSVAYDQEAKKVRFWGDVNSGLKGLAMLYHSNRHYHEALIVYSLLRERMPNVAKWPYLSADIHQSKNDFKAFLSDLEEVQTLGADYSPCLVKLGRYAMKKREMDRAEKLLKKALASDRNSIYAHEALARYYGRVGDHQKKKVVEESRKRLKGTGVGVDDPWLDEIYDYCYNAEQLLIRVDVSIENDDFEKALMFLRRINDVEPDNWKAYALLTHLEKTRGNHEAAVEAALHAIKLGADLETASVEIVQLLVKANHADRAEKIVHSLLEEHGKNSVLYEELAGLQGKRGDVDGAIFSLLEAERLNPSSAGVQAKMAELLWESGNKRASIFHFKRAVELSPTDSKSMLYLVQYYYDRKQFVEGESWLFKSLELEPDNEVLYAKASDFYERYGSQKLEQRDFNNAIRLFKLVLKYNPVSVRARQKLADALFKNGQKSEGMELLQLLVEEGRATPEVFMTLAEIAFEQGDYDQARKRYEHVIDRAAELAQYQSLKKVAGERVKMIQELSK